MTEPYRFIRRILPGQNGANRCGVCNGDLSTAIRAYLYASGPDVRLVTHPMCGPGDDPAALYCPTCYQRMHQRRRWDTLRHRWDTTPPTCVTCPAGAA